MVVRTSDLCYTMSVVEAEPGRGQVRMASFHLGDRVVFVVADGTGSATGGAFAAETLCDAVGESCSRVAAEGWTTWLRTFDASTPLTGLVAALIIEVTSDGHASGTSVGGCQAWLFRQTATELTANQLRRPLLGLAKAHPVGFAADVAGGVLVIATGGLWKRARCEWIRRITTCAPLEAAAATLIDAVVVEDGGPRDDTALCIVEVAARPSRRRRPKTRRSIQRETDPTTAIDCIKDAVNARATRLGSSRRNQGHPRRDATLVIAPIVAWDATQGAHSVGVTQPSEHP